MKFLTLLFFVLITFSNSFAQTPQTFNKLDVKELGLPNSSASRVMITNENKKAQSSNITINELESLSGISGSETIEERLNSVTTDIGTIQSDISNIDNTSDANKPISTATQAALDLKANDSAVVHKTGNESIAGNKDFTGEVNLNGLSQPCWNRTNAQMLLLTPSTSKCVYNTDKKAPFFYDAATLKWKQAGSSSGQGGLNYIENYSFEDDTTGWSLYNDSAAIPTDGTGGSSSLGIDASNVAPLMINDRYLLITKPASSIQGQGFSVDFNIQPAYAGVQNVIEFPYINSANLATGDVVVYLYDKTNSSFISLSNPTLVSSTKNATFTSNFTASTSLNYRLIFHIATTNATSWTLKLDNVKVGPFSEKFYQLNTENQSGWSACSPIVLTASTTNPTKGTVVTDCVKYRQSGEDIEAEYYFQQNGSPSAGSGTYFLGLPQGFSFHSSVPTLSAIPGNNTTKAVAMSGIGNGFMIENGVTTSIQLIPLAYTGDKFIMYVSSRNGNDGFVNSSFYGFNNINNSYRVSIKFRAKDLIATSPIVSGKCDDLRKCETTFSATLTSGGVVSAENLDWINGNANGATPYVIPFQTGLFSLTPNCSVTTLSNSVGGGHAITAVSTSSVTVSTMNTNTGGGSSLPFTIHCDRQGQDYLDAKVPFLIASLKESQVYKDVEQYHTDERKICDTCWKGGPKYRQCFYTSSGWTNGVVLKSSGIGRLLKVEGYWTSGVEKIPLGHYIYSSASCSVAQSNAQLHYKSTGNSGESEVCVEYKKD